MHRLALLALVPAMLAGCTDDDATDDATAGDGTPARAHDCRLPGPGDWSKETILIEVATEGPFSVDVPLPVSSDGTRFSHWVANLSVDGDGQASAVATDRGQAVRITGEGVVEVRSCTIQPQRGGNGCCAEQYLDAAWTTSPESTRPEALDVRLNSGSVSLSITYTAISDYCGRDASFGGSLTGSGWKELPGEDSAWCT